MKFGYFCNTTNWTHKPYFELLEETKDITEYCDKNNWNSIWFTEHHFNHEGMESCTNPLMLGADAAARTKNIILTSAVTVLSAADPVRTFQNYSTLDLISHGRAEMIVGRGSFSESFPLFGLNVNQYDEIFSEKLDLLLSIRDNETINWSGRFRPSLKNQKIYQAAS